MSHMKLYPLILTLLLLGSFSTTANTAPVAMSDLPDSPRAWVNRSMDFLDKHYNTGKLYAMNPGAGSNKLWSIEQQKQLFALFKNMEEMIGVKLTDSFLMVPNMTISGIYFSSDIEFSSCMLCRRKDCSGRISGYDEKLTEYYYGRVTDAEKRE